MTVVFITKEVMSYDEAPPSRILNLAQAIEPHEHVAIIARGSRITDTRIRTCGPSGYGFLSNQLYKVCAVFLTLWLLLRGARTVIVREYYYLLLLWPFIALFGARLVYDMHCFRGKELLVEGRRTKAAWVTALERLGHRFATRIIAISTGLIEDLRPSLRRKAFLLPNGVDLAFIDRIGTRPEVLKRHGIPLKGNVVAFLGNWMPWVDIQTLLDSASSLDATVVIVGHCYQDIDLASLRAKYPLVVFTDRIPHEDAVAILKRADLCVLPYKREAVLNHLSIRKTFEYLAAGKPIVMSDSPLAEREFLEEGTHCFLYAPGDPRSLARTVKKALGSPHTLRAMGTANKRLSLHFGWEEVISSSHLLAALRHYDEARRPVQGTISIVIKALNEEKHIERCVKSALAALKGLDGEVVLVDSKSTDRTVDLAKTYPIRVLQLASEKDRCCGVGPQIGYLHTTSDFIYILDGDMELDHHFLRDALPYFASPRVAGVGGNIAEQSRDNLAFQVRAKSHVVKKTTRVAQLGMGGLYRRSALADVGYFSHPRLEAYEEYDIGAELDRHGRELLRIPVPMVRHYGDETTSFRTLINRMRSGYLFGSGQYLRRSLKRKHFFGTLWELKIYVFTLAWIALGLLSLGLIVVDYRLLEWYGIATAVLIVLRIITKPNLKQSVFSLASWTFQALGMLLGFFKRDEDPRRIAIRVREVHHA